jgi:hypothetical protein
MLNIGHNYADKEDSCRIVCSYHPKVLAFIKTRARCAELRVK